MIKIIVKLKQWLWLNLYEHNFCLFYCHLLLYQFSLQDAPVQPHVREALARPRLAHHALRPSQGSTQRIIGDLRSVKWSTRQEERYRILSNHRAGLPTEPAPARGGEENDDSQTESRDGLSSGEVQVFDIVHEEEDVKMPGKVKPIFFPRGTLCTIHLEHFLYIKCTFWQLM